MTAISTENCAVCAATLVYATEPRTMACAVCGTAASTLIYCPYGHYVCDACHRLDAVAALRSVLASSDSKSPHELLERVMAHPRVPMHGPEHHVFVPAVLVAASRNAGYELHANALEEAISRGSKVPGGWCGYHGACGAGIGVGIAASVITRATPLRGPQRGLAILATSQALERLADFEARCCKRAAWTALSAAVVYFRERLDIVLPEAAPLKCAFTARNHECAKEKCPYYSG